MARFACPGCGALFEVVAEHLGRTVRCPGCGEPLGTSSGVGAGFGPGPGGTGGSPGPGLGGVSRGGSVLPGAAGGSPPAGYFPPAGPTQSPAGYAPPGYWPTPPGYWPVQPAKRFNPHGLIALLIGLAVWGGYLVVTSLLVAEAPGLMRASSIGEMLRESERLARNPPPWLPAATAGLALLGLAGLIVAIVALTRPGRRRGFAVSGLVIALLNLCCLGPGAIGHLVR